MILNKSKTAAWFVSNCNAFSKRDELTKKLQKYIDIDVYGRCGNLVCPEKDPENKCEKMINSTYKFYLSFENALCIDYVTEKLFRTMHNYVIPVVFNGADMNRFVPPYSVINANDFETVEDLADYLKFLSKDLDEYKKYFWWKKHYKIVEDGDSVAYCNLCKKINEMNVKHKKQVYVDILKWWYEDSCTKTRIKF